MHKNTHIERVLIVLNPDGSFKAAHQESLSIIKDGDTVLASVQEPATALMAEALSQALPTQGALLAQLAAMTVERDNLRAGAGSLTIPEAPLDVSPTVVEELAVAPLEAEAKAPAVE